MGSKSESQAEVDLKVEKAIELFKEQLLGFSECRGKLASHLQAAGENVKHIPHSLSHNYLVYFVFLARITISLLLTVFHRVQCSQRSIAYRKGLLQQ